MLKKGPLVLHIPHASKFIPAKYRNQFVLNDDDLNLELLRLTDAFTDEIFDCPGAEKIIMPVSRLVVDAERFADDEQEPMAARGMGVIYTETSGRYRLRRALSEQEKRELLELYYHPHHRALIIAVREALEDFGQAMVIDCHSFPSSPLKCDIDQSPDRPDICLGTNAYHTSSELLATIKDYFVKLGYSVKVDNPYSGTLVPLPFLEKDKRVSGIMIEINRKLYMNETNGDKLRQSMSVKKDIANLMLKIERFLKRRSRNIFNQLLTSRRSIYLNF